MKLETLIQLANFVERTEPGATFLLDALDSEIAEDEQKAKDDAIAVALANAFTTKYHEQKGEEKKCYCARGLNKGEHWGTCEKPSEESVGEKCDGCRDAVYVHTCKRPMFTEEQLGKIIEAVRLEMTNCTGMREVIDRLRSLTLRNEV